MRAALCLALTAGVLVVGTAVAIADDPLTKAKADLDLATAQLNAAKQQLLVELENEKVAIAKKNIADKELEAAQQKLAAAQERLKLPVQLMKMLSGQVMVIRDHKLTCDAMPYLRWKCNGQPVCDFSITKDICGYPEAATDAVQLSISYRCGETIVDGTFWTGQQAYLTCK